MLAVLGGAAQKLASAGPARSAWTPPADAYRGSGCTAGLGTAIVGAPVQVAPADDGSQPGAVARSRAGASECSWADPARSGDEYVMTVLAGGRWAFDDLSRNGLQYLGGDAVAPQALAGTDGALVQCGQACVAAISYRGSLVMLTLSLPGADEQSALDGMVSRIVGALGTAE
jgi:hypothetical protein